jgi:hypothetical protein
VTTLHVILALAALVVPLLLAYAIVERLAQRASEGRKSHDINRLVAKRHGGQP